MERFGACCDDMQGLIGMVAGDGECDAGSVEWSPTATSRITRAAQCVVFSTVMAEARMVRDVMDLDVYGRERAALPGAGPRGTRGGGCVSLSRWGVSVCLLVLPRVCLTVCLSVCLLSRARVCACVSRAPCPFCPRAVLID